jgi:hypothetical protein
MCARAQEVPQEADEGDSSAEEDDGPAEMTKRISPMQLAGDTLKQADVPPPVTYSRCCLHALLPGLYITCSSCSTACSVSHVYDFHCLVLKFMKCMHECMQASLAPCLTL